MERFPPHPLAAAQIPPIFKLGPHPMLFHVLPSPGQAFLELTIKVGVRRTKLMQWGGGAVTELPWASYIVVPNDVEEVAGPREVACPNICARLVRAEWVMDCMGAAQLLSPSSYEVGR
jgi:hypothetical protein